MIEQIELKDFQTHRSFKLRFEAGVTVITGESDAGKSAIIRALRWVIFNRPGGNACINWDADFAAVRLTVDGRKIVRKRGKENTYKLDKQPFKAIGTKVPEPIALLLNCTADNLQQQHDGLYWFTLTPPALAKELNRIVNLEAIDSVQADIKSRIRKQNATIGVLDEQRSEAESEVEATDWVPKAVRLAKTIKATHTKLKRTDSDASVLRDTLERVSDITTEQQNAAERRTEAAQIADTSSDLHELLEDSSSLQQLLYRYNKTQRTLKEIQTQLKAVQAEIKTTLDDQCPLCGRGD